MANQQVHGEEELMVPRFQESQSLSKTTLAMIGMFLVVVALGAGFAGWKLGVSYHVNALCCQIPPIRSAILYAKEKLGLATTFNSDIGTDKWVSEAIFPDVKDGFFLDVGAADSTFMSNTKVLEQKGWTGICVDAFPHDNLKDRTCQVFKAVVSSEAGKRVKFWKGGLWGGITDTLGSEVTKIRTAPIEEFTTVTLGDILERAKAPRFIHFMSLDIEGGELNALKGFPFDKYEIGALAVEHYYEEPKRTEIKRLMESHGYRRVHTYLQDDFYLSPGQLLRANKS